MGIIERVARVLHAIAPGLSIDGSAIGWEALSDEARGACRAGAARVIAALRTPTDAMLAEGDRRDLPHDAANVWERMLFCALREGEG